MNSCVKNYKIQDDFLLIKRFYSVARKLKFLSKNINWLFNNLEIIDERTKRNYQSMKKEKEKIMVQLLNTNFKNMNDYDINTSLKKLKEYKIKVIEERNQDERILFNSYMKISNFCRKFEEKILFFLFAKPEKKILNFSFLNKVMNIYFGKKIKKNELKQKSNLFEIQIKIDEKELERNCLSFLPYSAEEENSLKKIVEEAWKFRYKKIMIQKYVENHIESVYGTNIALRFEESSDQPEKYDVLQILHFNFNFIYGLISKFRFSKENNIYKNEYENKVKIIKYLIKLMSSISILINNKVIKMIQDNIMELDMIKVKSHIVF